MFEVNFVGLRFPVKGERKGWNVGGFGKEKKLTWTQRLFPRWYAMNVEFCRSFNFETYIPRS